MSQFATKDVGVLFSNLQHNPKFSDGNKNGFTAIGRAPSSETTAEQKKAVFQVSFCRDSAGVDVGLGLAQRDVVAQQGKV